MSKRPRGHLAVTSLADAVYHALCDKVFSGEIRAGEVVTENGIAEHFDVARPTAKAAIERLVHEGLLQRSPNKSASVPILGVADVRDVYWTRRLLEEQVFRALARERQVSVEARRFAQEMHRLVYEPVLTDVIHADIGFHRALVAQLGSPRFSVIYDAVMGAAHLCMAQVQLHQLLHPGRIATEHDTLIAAVEAGDEERACAEVRDHLNQARDRLIAYLEVEAREPASPAVRGVIDAASDTR